jgi:Putative transposase
LPGGGAALRKLRTVDYLFVGLVPLFDNHAKRAARSRRGPRIGYRGLARGFAQFGRLVPSALASATPSLSWPCSAWHFTILLLLGATCGPWPRPISNRRLIALDEGRVTFKVKDYRIEGPGRYTTMTLDIGEFIRRFLIHVLPKGFHRIRHYGLFASSNRAETIAQARELLGLVTSAADASTKAQQTVETDPAAQPLANPCPCCGGRMFIIETFEAGCQPRHRPAAPLVAIRIDTS